MFHWWLKSLSDSEIDRHTLGDRYRVHVEQPTLRPELLPPIAAEPRAMPRLSRVRYDALYKHLRAHLPEMRDLGDHFPSGVRFQDQSQPRPRNLMIVRDENARHRSTKKSCER